MSFQNVISLNPLKKILTNHIINLNMLHLHCKSNPCEVNESKTTTLQIHRNFNEVFTKNNNIKTLFWLYFLLLQNHRTARALKLPCTRIRPWCP